MRARGTAQAIWRREHAPLVLVVLNPLSEVRGRLVRSLLLDPLRLPEPKRILRRAFEIFLVVASHSPECQSRSSHGMLQAMLTRSLHRCDSPGGVVVCNAVFPGLSFRALVTLVPLLSLITLVPLLSLVPLYALISLIPLVSCSPARTSQHTGTSDTSPQPGSSTTQSWNAAIPFSPWSPLSPLSPFGPCSPCPPSQPTGMCVFPPPQPSMHPT